MLSLNVPPDPELIKEIAIELGVSPSFVEKDWYAVQAIRLVAEANFGDLTAVFSGGTSLSKGYGLIQRFSEDMDFKVEAKIHQTRAQCRAFRKEVCTLIEQHENFTIDKQSIASRDGSKFFSCNISYPQQFDLDDALRKTGLQLEMRIQNNPTFNEHRDITSFVSQFKKETPETKILCIQPLETAADKFSALLWRITTRDRKAGLGEKNNDPIIIRHLHDLCALKEVVIEDDRFASLVREIFQKDIGRGGSNKEFSIEQTIELALKTITSEEDDYRKEYDQFVAAMSYAPTDETITYDQSFEAFEEIAKTIISNAR